MKKTLRSVIDDYCQLNALSLTDFAREADVSYVTVSNTRLKKPSAKTYQKIATVLNIPASELTILPIQLSDEDQN